MNKQNFFMNLLSYKIQNCPYVYYNVTKYKIVNCPYNFDYVSISQYFSIKNLKTL